MVVDLEVERVDTVKLDRVIEWIAQNPYAAARLILMLMPEGTWEGGEDVSG